MRPEYILCENALLILEPIGQIDYICVLKVLNDAMERERSNRMIELIELPYLPSF